MAKKSPATPRAQIVEPPSPYSRYRHPLHNRPSTRKVLDKAKLYAMAQTLLPTKTIAMLMDCREDLIYDRYAEVLQKGREDRKHSLSQVMWHKALVEGNVVMMIWLSKQHLGYRESFPDAPQQLNFNVVINEVP